MGATLDCLGRFDSVKVVAEIYMDIHHIFASKCENLKDIKRIYSHPQGYNQCRKFLDDHMLSAVEFIPAKSTAQAAQLASSEPNSAAICSKIAAKLYGVPILFETIEDNAANRTRFFILSDFKNERAQRNKTSILAKTEHRPCGLVELLLAFRDEGINITKLESRPIKQREFKANFYIDFEGHIDDDNVQKAIQKAISYGHETAWLGSYVAWEE